jgi:hypothetical protein
MEIIREDYHFDTMVIARNHLENRGFAPYSCQVEQWLQEYDPDLAIWWNARDNKFRVVDSEYWTVMEFEPWQLSYGIVNHVKRIDSRRGFNAVDEVERNDNRMQREQDKLIEDVSYNLAQDGRKYISNLN